MRSCREYIEIIKKFMSDRTYRFFLLSMLGFFNGLSDETYIKMMWKLTMDYPLNIHNPRTFNEKLQWLKLHDRRFEYTVMADKYLVKDYVSNLIGGEYVIPLIGVWDSVDDIDFDGLPNQFVLKCTHTSGGMVICRDKDRFDQENAKKKLRRYMRQEYYWHGREWPYKDVVPRILAEQYMEDDNTAEIKDSEKVLTVYKFFTFSGEPMIIQTIQNDKTEFETIDYFDCEWNLLELHQDFPNSKEPLKKPENLEKMLELVRKLSSPTIPFLRVDMYEISGRVYFSEYTFYSDNGTAIFSPRHWDNELGDLIRIS